MKPIINFVCAHYAIVKLLSDKFITKSEPMLSIICTILTIPIVCFISTTLLAIFWLYKQAIIVLLKLKLGRNYAGIASGCDVLFKIFPNDLPVCVKVEIESHKTGRELFHEIQQKVAQFITERKCDKKLFSIRKCAFGYVYYEEVNDIDVNEVLYDIEIDNPRNQPGIIDSISRYFEAPFPKNGDFNWEMYFSTTPIQTNRYILIMRVHHAIADGIGIYNVFSNLLCKPITTTNTPKFIETAPRKSAAKMQYCFPMRDPPNDQLHDSAPHLKTQYAYFHEEMVEYVPKIKAIKRKIANVSFTDVFYGAYSASLADYYKKYAATKKVPESIICMKARQMQMNRLNSLGPNQDKDIHNDFSVLGFYLPIVPMGKADVPVEEYLIERVLMVSGELEKLYNSFDLQVSYVIFSTYCKVLPYQLTKYVFPIYRFTGAISCLPVGPKREFFNGDIVKNAMFFAQRQNYYGIGLFTLTYDDKLNIGLFANKDKVENYENLNGIMKGIFKYIDLMYDEVKEV